jgi:serine/threonine-protein kinase
VDRTGAVYLIDYRRGVLKLAPGASRADVLPFGPLNNPTAVAVDRAGAVYVTSSRNQVLKLAPGASGPVVVLSDLDLAWGLAVDDAGALYVTENGPLRESGQVRKLQAGATSADVLPFSGLRDDSEGVAVDTSGTVYVSDEYNNRVVALSSGLTGQIVLPFTDLDFPHGVAVDGAGSLYVADFNHNRVLKLPAQ